MRVVFGAIITEGHGKLGGMIVQQSYGGYQMRNLKQPLKNPSKVQSVNRVNYAYVTKAWRGLSNDERQSFNDNAPMGTSGFEFFNSLNLALSSSGNSIITEYTPPVDNPTAFSPFFYSQTYNDSDPVPNMSFNLVSGINNIPTGDWIPAFLWTGWVPSSIYSYPRINRKIYFPTDSYSSSSYTIYWGTNDNPQPFPPAAGSKCLFTERWINNSTGQQFIGSTYEIIAGEVHTIGRGFVASPTLQNAVLTGTPGNYELVTTWEPTGSNFDDTTWNPKFYMNNWGTSSEAETDPYTNLIPNTAVNITSPTSMTITFSDAPGMAIPPTVANQWTGIGFNWQKISDSSISVDSKQDLEAANV